MFLCLSLHIRCGHIGPVAWHRSLHGNNHRRIAAPRIGGRPAGCQAGERKKQQDKAAQNHEKNDRGPLPTGKEQKINEWLIFYYLKNSWLRDVTHICHIVATFQAHITGIP